MKSKKLKVLICVVLAIFLVAGACFGIYMARVWHYKQAVDQLTYSELYLSAVADGTYTGDCDVGFIYAKVRVTVERGRITWIELAEHRNGRGAAAERITDDVLQEQRIDVDAITGATNSSKVIKKAIENALAAGLK